MKRGECDSPVRWMMRYGRGESHSPKKLLDDNGGESHSSQNNGIANSNRNNAPQYIGEFGVIEIIRTKRAANEKTRI